MVLDIMMHYVEDEKRSQIFCIFILWK